LVTYPAGINGSGPKNGRTASKKTTVMERGIFRSSGIESADRSLAEESKKVVGSGFETDRPIIENSAHRSSLSTIQKR
jgi:hypothetical protein